MKFKSKKSGIVMNVRSVISEQDTKDWLEKNPNYEILEGETPKRSETAAIISGQGQGNYIGQARQKHDGWNDVLDKIEEAHPYADFRE